MKNMKDFIFAPDLDFQVSIPSDTNQSATDTNTNQPPAKINIPGLENFTAAQHLTIDENNAENVFHFKSVKTLEGYAFAFGPNSQTKDILDTMLTFDSEHQINETQKIKRVNSEESNLTNHHSVQLEYFDPVDIFACRTFKTKDGYKVSGYSATQNMMLLAYNPKDKKLISIFSPFVQGVRPIEDGVDVRIFKNELKRGTYIFAISPPNDISQNIKSKLDLLPKDASIDTVIKTISAETQFRLLAAFKLPRKREEKDFINAVSNDNNVMTVQSYLSHAVSLDPRKFKQAIIEENQSYLQKFTDIFGLQVALDMLAKFSNLSANHANTIAPDKLIATDSFFQNYFNQHLKIDIHQNYKNSKIEITQFIQKSNLTFDNAYKLLLGAGRTAPDNSLSKEQLQFAQQHFYQALYQKQKRARLPKTIAAFAIGGLFALPTLGISIGVAYFLWNRAKKNETLQMREIKLVSPDSSSKIMNTMSKPQEVISDTEVLLETPEDLENGKQPKEKSFLHESNEDENHLTSLRKSSISNGKHVRFFGQKNQIEKMDKKMAADPALYATRDYPTLSSK